MTETLSRTSPHTGTVLPEGRPFWIVDGRAYDFTEWIGQHPGGSMWFTQSVGRDISALLHTYHPEPARLQKILAKYEIGAQCQPDVPPGLTERPSPPTAKDILPKLGVPPFLLDPDFDARRDLPHLDIVTREASSRTSAARCTPRSPGSNSRSTTASSTR